MNRLIGQKWGAITLVLHPIRIVCPQIPGFPFVFPPPPMQVIHVPIPVTTTTTPRPQIQAIAAMPLPVPMPVPMPVPILPHPHPDFCAIHPRSPGCPPCPPCLCTPACTPAFYSFCSPCHLRCRCRGRANVPMPMPLFGPPPPPMPVPPPGPIYVVPPVYLPGHRCNRRHRVTVSDSSSGGISDSSSSSDSGVKRRRKYRRKRLYRNHRRNLRRKDDLNVRESVKPVLAFVNHRGDVKVQKRLTNNEATQLLNDKSSSSDQDLRRGLKVSDLTADEGSWPKLASNTRSKQIILRNGPTSHVLAAGQKELVFKPPGHKTISNLSITFQVV